MTMTPKELAEDLRRMATCSLEIERRKLAAAAAALDDLARIRSVTIEGVAVIEKRNLQQQATIDGTGSERHNTQEHRDIATLLDVVRAMGAALWELARGAKEIPCSGPCGPDKRCHACMAKGNMRFWFERSRALEDEREHLRHNLHAARAEVADLTAQRDGMREFIQGLGGLDAARKLKPEIERLKLELVSMNEAGADAVSNAHGQGQENALADVARTLGWREWTADGWERLAKLQEERDALAAIICEAAPFAWLEHPSGTELADQWQKRAEAALRQHGDPSPTTSRKEVRPLPGETAHERVRKGVK